MAIDLKMLRKGTHSGPPRLLIYGEHGLGKSTFASEAPNPVFVVTEDGLGAIDTTAFPLAKRYQDVLDAMAALYTEQHDYETVVIDSLDWLEDLIWRHIAKEAGHESIEDFGYGKGYTYATDRFREVLSGLNALRAEKGMAVILTAHCKVTRFDDPASEPYDRYVLKLHAKTAALVQEWAEVVAFACQDTVVKKEDVGFGRKAARGVATGGHVMRLKRTPAFDAKSRLRLPDTLPLSWTAFAEAMANSQQPDCENSKENSNG